MNDAEYEGLMARLRRLTDKWAPVMVPNNVTCQRYFHRTTADFLATKESDVVTADCDAYCTSSYPYMYTNLHFNMEPLVVRNDDYLENVIVHELVHPFLHELAPDDEGRVPSDWAIHNEHATTGLAWAFIRSLELARHYEPVTDEY